MKGELGLRWIRAFPIDSFLSCSSIRPDSLSLDKRLKQIKDETESKVTTRGELLSHLTSLEKLLNKNPKSKGKIKPLIRRVSIKLSKLS